MAALEAVHGDPALQRFGRRRSREREAAAPDDADVLRDHIRERVDVLPPRDVEVALEQQVRVALLLIGRELAEDRPADVVDELELKAVVAEVGVVARAAHHEPQERHPKRAYWRQQRQAAGAAGGVPAARPAGSGGRSLDCGAHLFLTNLFLSPPYLAWYVRDR